MRKAVSGYLACQPVAYRTPKDKPDFTSLPEFPLALDPLQLTRKEMGDYALRAREIGINYIGSCCGSVAIHVREMARALGKLPEDGASLEKGRRKTDVGLRVLRARRSCQPRRLNPPQKHEKRASHHGWPRLLGETQSSRCVTTTVRSRDQLLERASSGCPFSFKQV